MNGVSPSTASQNTPRPKKKPAVNPLVSSRRPKTQAFRPQPSKLNTPKAPTNITQPPAYATTTAHSSRPAPTRPAFTERPRSPTPEGQPQIFPLYSSTRADLEGLRNHVARLQSKLDVDVTNEHVFTRPVKLHRRDPNSELSGPAETDVDVEMKTEEDDKDRERIEAIKAERQRIREETAKMIAPSIAKKKNPAAKKKVESIRGLEDPEDEKRRQIKYEEALPWHLEDFDNRHTWVGSYEATLSDRHIMLVTEEKSFRVVPLEKWYRFREKGNFKRLNADDAEAYLKKRTKEPRWLLKHMQQEAVTKQQKKEAFASTGLFKRSGEQEDIKGELFGLGRGDGEEGEGLDFNDADLFDDDDEENPFEEVEEDEKEGKQRVKKEQLTANVFDMADEKEVDDEEERSKMLAELQRELEKGTRKVLVRQEKNHIYDESDDGNPYSSKSEEESEEQNDDEEKKDGKPDDQSKINGQKSGTSTKGENTPSDRKKHLKLGVKRSGSPNLSEASGNESSRKKARPNTLKRPLDVEASGASGNESGYKSKKNQHLTTKANKGGPRSLGQLSSFRSGSGSESETIRRSRVNLSTRGTPAGSRAQSPSGVEGKRGSKPPTRAASPEGMSPGTTAPSRSTTPATALREGFPTKEEILAAVPEDGLSFNAMLTIFKPRLKSAEAGTFATLMRKVCDVDAKSKWIRRRNS